MGPLFLVDSDQKRVQYYSFLGKNPNDLSFNHRRIDLKIAPVYIEGVKTVHMNHRYTGIGMLFGSFQIW
jgi:hypothetical protein